MAFPAVNAASTTFSSTGSTTMTVTYPTGITAGDRLLVMVTFDGSPTTSGWPAGWTQRASAVDATNAVRVQVYEKVAAGTETGSFNVTVSASEAFVGECLRITGAHASQAVEVTTATGSSTNPNAPALNPSGWDVQDTLWIIYAGGDAGATNFTGTVANYGTPVFRTVSNAANGVSTVYATRQAAIASDDAAAFTRATEQWVAATIAVRPLPAVVTGSAAVAATATVVVAATQFWTFFQRTAAVAATGGLATVGAAIPVFPLAAVLDDFNRADGTIGTTNWHEDITGVGIALPRLISNQATSQASATANAWWTPQVFNQDQEVYATLVTWLATTGRVHRLYLRLQDPDTASWSGYWLELNHSGTSSTILVSKRVATVTTNVIATTLVSTHQPGDVIGLRATGATISAIRARGGTVSVLGQAVDASPLLQTGYAGFHVSIGHTIDDFGGGNLVAATVVTGQAVLDGAGQVQAAGVRSAAPVTRSAALTATGAVAAAGISIVSASATVNAAAAIATAGHETLARSAAIGASASIASAGVELLPRLAELAAAGNISAAGQVESGAEEVEGSATLAATGGIAAAGQETLVRAAAVSAAATISSTGQVAAAGATIERAAALAATGTITADGAVNPPVEVPARRRGGRLIKIRKPALVTAAAAFAVTARIEVAAARDTFGTAAVSATTQLFTAGIRTTTAGAGLAAVSAVAATATRTTYSTATFDATVRLAATGTTTRNAAARLDGAGRVYVTATHWPKPVMSNRQRDEELLLLIGGP